ncbi:MAG: ABC transporter permease [Anaerolineae bacterium]|nr:ABC transporter permease [Anaerolineae bacterium]
MLGIIIGVGAVITLMSAGEGVQVYITNQFESIGTNLFFIIPGSFEQELKRPAYLTLKDVEALSNRNSAPDILRVAPLVQGSARLTAPGKERVLEVHGVTVEYPLVRNWEVAIGEFFVASDDQAQSRIVVLGKTTADYFFPDQLDLTGEFIRINGVPFRIIGVMAERGGSNFQDEDNVALIPMNTALSRIFPRRTNTGQSRLSFLYVQSTNEDRMDAAMEEAAQILRQQHRIAPGQPDDFTAISQSDIIGTFQQITNVLTVFLGAIAGISLLVGGIGIMNIMLVSVTERTREIGLRKAVGARKGDILLQFLTEAVLLSSFGGGIGIIVGASGAALTTYFLRDQGFSAILTAGSVTLATLFSAAVGLFFGIYPAQRAASLNPIDALRYE